MLVDEIKSRMFKAMKAGNTVEKEILRVAMGEITTDAARPGRTGSDDEARAILRKLLKSNEETLAQPLEDAQRAALLEENRVLLDLLPKAPSLEDIQALLSSVAGEIRAAGNDGQATGVAMKHLKASGASVDGKLVAQAVKALRTP
ncbi:MAG TPA: GatB/YqeY domain-containing protein [Polyangiaceae bacterium]|nr:GatB/YqeY domain-containing protein [Polyangiaceae bacterium]